MRSAALSSSVTGICSFLESGSVVLVMPPSVHLPYSVCKKYLVVILYISVPPFYHVAFQTNELLKFTFLPLLKIKGLHRAHDFRAKYNLFTVSFTQFSHLQPFRLFSRELQSRQPLQLPIDQGIYKSRLLCLPIIESCCCIANDQRQLPLNCNNSMTSTFSFHLARK